ncbi:MAG: DUF2339 domain-containing protein, partial [Proteobacteria bacterium]|nr:DUF2339 domain-containing protein [Pseudomonadota bacterium]
SLLFFSISFLAMAIVAKRLTWRHLSSTLLCFFPALVILVPFSLNDFSLHVHLLTQWSSIAWLPAILLQYRIMWQFEDEWPSQAIPLWHLGTMWFVIFVLSLETAWAVDYLIQGEEIWPLICWGLVPGALVLALIRKGGAFPWPVKKHANQYLDNGISVPVCFLLLWLLITCTQEGRPGPLPYLPLINPLELAQFFVFYVLIVYVWTGTRKPYALQAEFPEYTGIMVLGGVVFVWLNSVVARIVSNYSHTSFEARSLFSSDVFQAGISGLWTLIAMAITVWATRKGNRPVWMTGSVLLGMVVLKLFIVDLSGIGTIARIVSFLVVGVLMLLIGYFSPLPPKIMENSK